MNKDQSYGGLILAVSGIVFFLYIIALTSETWRPWVLGAPVVLAVLGVLGITGWIGYTMLTTPPPAPLEADMGASTSTSSASATKTDEKH